MLSALRPLMMKQRWFLATRRRNPDDLQSYLDPAGYKILPCPAGEFHADPFLWEHDGQTWIFFERYRYLHAKGTIACMRLDSNEIEDVLIRPYHLSYPHLFEEGGVLWMIPETSENRSVELYHCAAFPNRWELASTLIEDVDLSDATYLRSAGLHWILASSQIGRSDLHRLYMWRAPSLLGPWERQSSDPVLVSTNGARCGGSVFESGGQVVRPTQVCHGGYGRGLQFRRIALLSREEFRDEAVGSLCADAFGWDGLHTYSRTSRLEAVDGYRLTFDPLGKLQGLVGKLTRRLR